MKTPTPGLLPSLMLLAAVLFGLAGCDTTTKLDEPAHAAPVETRQTGAGGSPSATASPTVQSRVATVDLSAKGGDVGAAGVTAGAAAGTAGTALAGRRVVYFDFDSYVVKDEFTPMIDSVAHVLTADPRKHVVVEGHTDERGGSEYNLALGQKRAAAVVQSLTLLGARDSQLEAVSFGKERPAADGHDEAAWAKNRRAELKDR